MLFGSVAASQLFAGEIYWTDRDGRTIRRGDMDGSGAAEILLTGADGLSEPRGLGLDVAGGKMYFADAGNGTIRRANLDGSQIHPLITGRPFLGDLELDVDAGKMYWTEIFSFTDPDHVDNAVRRANLDGSDPEYLFRGLTLPYYMDLDRDNEKIYWAENANTVIHIGNMDGTGAIETLDVGFVRVRDLAVDLVNSRIYWGERDVGTVNRCNLDGTGVATLFDGGDGLQRPHGLEIDVAGGMVYWTDTRTYAVNRGRMDGVGPVDVLYDNLPDAWDIELAIPEPSTFVLAIVGLLGISLAVYRKRRCR